MYLSKLLKDPLIHFFTIGVILFVVLSAVSPAPQGERIMVDRERLLTFIQSRAKAFEAGTVAFIFEKMTSVERELLIKEYFREEALYREAHALGLDRSDYVIRRRMVKNLEFMSETIFSTQSFDEELLREYYERHKTSYYKPAGITFTHVFISAEARGGEAAKVTALDMLDRLQKDSAGFADAVHYGERFLYHTNYVERTFDLVKNHFGKSAADIIFSDKIPLLKWYGPIMSDYGAHLIFITAHTPGETLTFPTVRSRIIQALTRDRQRASTEKFIDNIIRKYTAIIAPDVSIDSAEPLYIME